MSRWTKARWTLVAGAGAVIVLLLAALRIAAHREAPPPAVSDPGPPQAAPAPAPAPQATPAPARAPAEVTTKSVPEAEAAPETTTNMSAAPPLPSRDQVRARPARPAPAAAEDHAHDPRQASLDLVERSIERLEAAARVAEQAGDQATAQRGRIRIERLRRRRAALQAEIAGEP